MNWMNTNATRSRPSSIKVRRSKSAVLQTCFLLLTLLTLLVIIFVGRGSCREILQVACVWYTVVDQNSFIYKLPFFISLRGQEINFRVSQVFLSGGCDGDLCWWDALKLHVNDICENDLANSHVQMQSHVGIVPPGNSRLTWRCKRDAARGCCVGYGFATAFAELSRKILCKSTTKPHPEWCLGVQLTWLITINIYIYINIYYILQYITVI